MDNNQDTKKYPSVTDEVAKLLNLEGSNTAHSSTSGSIAVSHLPVANLPVAPENNAHGHEEVAAHSETEHVSTVHETSTLDALENKPAYIKGLKIIAPFIGLFAVGLFLYYFFFSSVDFNSIFKNTTNKVTQQTTVTSPKETELEKLKSQEIDSYRTWIKDFYYDVSDTKITDPDTDNSGNGLSNFQKYLLNLNPKSYDTLGLGMADSQALASGINPLSGNPLNTAQKQIVEKYIDMEVVMNRLSLAALNNPGTVAGANTTVNNTTGFGLRGIGSMPRTQVQTIPSNFASPQTGANITPSGTLDMDQSVNIKNNVNGTLEIPSLKISVPVVWSADPKNFEKDLQTGVVHYPGTALPGQIGTTYIAGHSSNYAWAKGSYNSVFRNLGDLKDNSSFSVSVTDINGKKITYHYVVNDRKEYSPTDPAQIVNNGKSIVALSTCWPLNSTAKRLVVYGQLTQVER